MKSIVIVLITCLTSACSNANPRPTSQVYGLSHANEQQLITIQNSLLKQAIPLWHNANCHQIDRIDRQRVNPRQSTLSSSTVIYEKWRITACGVMKTYNIRFQTDTQRTPGFVIQVPPLEDH